MKKKCIVILLILLVVCSNISYGADPDIPVTRSNNESILCEKCIENKMDSCNHNSN